MLLFVLSLFVQPCPYQQYHQRGERHAKPIHRCLLQVLPPAYQKSNGFNKQTAYGAQHCVCDDFFGFMATSF